MCFNQLRRAEGSSSYGKTGHMIMNRKAAAEIIFRFAAMVRSDRLQGIITARVVLQRGYTLWMLPVHLYRVCHSLMASNGYRNIIMFNARPSRMM